MKISRSGLAILLASLATASVAYAGADSDDLHVTATVTDTCIITGGTLDFGTYDTVVGTELEATTNLTVECTAGAVTYITLDQGANADAGSTADAPLRRLASGGAFLAYSLYSDATYGDIWGGSSATGVDYTAANANAFPEPVYGKLHGGQDVPAGTYTDTVVATINF